MMHSKVYTMTVNRMQTNMQSDPADDDVVNRDVNTVSHRQGRRAGGFIFELQQIYSVTGVTWRILTCHNLQKKIQATNRMPVDSTPNLNGKKIEPVERVAVTCDL